MYQNNMVIHFLIVYIGALCADTSEGQPTIEYLKGVHRFNSTGYTDYYFCCNVIGRFLRWQYNDEPLTGFIVGDAGRVVVDTRSTFNYTATLLSSQPDKENSEQAALDSVFVVSFNIEPPSTFEVTCGSTSSFTTKAVGNMSDVVRASSNNSEVVLDYILSSSIVQDKNKTHIFVCGVQNMLQYFEINGSPIGFRGHDDIGQDRTVLSEDGNIVNIQGVLIARQPYTSALLFVSEDSDVNVTCYFGSHQVKLSSSGHTTTPEPSATSLLPYPTVPPSSSLAPIPSMLASPAEMMSSEPHYTHGPNDVISNKIHVDVIITCGFISFIMILLGITIPTLWCYVSTRRSANSSLEAPKDETPAKEKELPPKNMEKRVIEASSSLEAPKDETPAEEMELPLQTMVNGARNIIPSLCGINATTREQERSNQDSVEEMQPLIQDFIVQPNCCNMEDIPVSESHELEQQPEDKLAADDQESTNFKQVRNFKHLYHKVKNVPFLTSDQLEQQSKDTPENVMNQNDAHSSSKSWCQKWSHALPVYLDQRGPSESYSSLTAESKESQLDDGCIYEESPGVDRAELAAGSFSKRVYVNKFEDEVYIMERDLGMEDIPVFVTHELEQQPEDKLATEWLHACPVYLVPSENYSLGFRNAALIVGSFSKMFYNSEDTEAVYIMEDHAHDNEDRVIKEEKPCFKWMTLPGQDDVEEFTDIPEWESPPVPDWYQPLDQPKIRLEEKRKISPEEEKEIPDVEREIPEVSPEETEIAEVSPEESQIPEGSPEESQIPEGSPEETEIPEVSPEETEIPEVSTKEEVELFSEEAIKEWPGELFEDSPDEEDEVLKVGPEEENVPEDAHANPRDVYDLCPVNLIDTERFCVKVFRGLAEILRRSMLSLQKSIRALELMTSSDTSYPRVSYLHLTYLGNPQGRIQGWGLQPPLLL